MCDHFVLNVRHFGYRIKLTDAVPEVIYKLVVGSSTAGFGAPFSTEEACSKT
jgi:hypothetical protein